MKVLHSQSVQVNNTTTTTTTYVDTASDTNASEEFTINTSEGVIILYKKGKEEKESLSSILLKKILPFLEKLFKIIELLGTLWLLFPLSWKVQAFLLLHMFQNILNYLRTYNR